MASYRVRLMPLMGVLEACRASSELRRGVRLLGGRAGRSSCVVVSVVGESDAAMRASAAAR